MAHYKMCVQLRGQSKAFFHGFREFIQNDWLGMFSGPEVQKLISGDSTTLDVSDLRYVDTCQSRQKCKCPTLGSPKINGNVFF